MSALIGKAAEEDEEFYNAELWQEGGDSENESYESESASSDEFDSDFNETEDEEESGGSDEEREASKRIREMVSFIFL